MGEIKARIVGRSRLVGTEAVEISRSQTSSYEQWTGRSDDRTLWWGIVLSKLGVAWMNFSSESRSRAINRNLIRKSPSSCRVLYPLLPN